MIYIVRGLPLALLLLCCQPALALSGGEYIDKCSPEKIGSLSGSAQESIDKALDAGSCTGFTGGVLNGANLIGQMLIKQKALKVNFICLPGKLHATALVEKSVAYIRNKPALKDLPAQAGIFEALSNAYPCSEAPEPPGQ